MFRRKGVISEYLVEQIPILYFFLPLTYVLLHRLKSEELFSFINFLSVWQLVLYEFKTNNYKFEFEAIAFVLFLKVKRLWPLKRPVPWL